MVLTEDPDRPLYSADNVDHPSADRLGKQLAGGLAQGDGDDGAVAQHRRQGPGSAPKSPEDIGLKRYLLVLLTFLACLSSAWAQHIPLPASSISLESPAGQQLLLASRDRGNYWPLSSRHETQCVGSHCGPASCVMVLNALGVPAPAAAHHPPFREFEQGNFFTPETDKILPEAQLRRRGATLEQLGAMLECHGVKVDVHHAQDGGLEEFRLLARRAVGSSGEFVIVNFLRKPLAQISGAHFSPLAAYHAETDRFLVMDVARYKYPPFWVTAESLFSAMTTLDRESGKNRGYLLIRADR